MMGAPPLTKKEWSRRAPSFFPTSPGAPHAAAATAAPATSKVASPSAVAAGKLLAKSKIAAWDGADFSGDSLTGRRQENNNMKGAGEREIERAGRKEQGKEEAPEEDEVAVIVKSGRLDTLGWMSDSWKPRRVILRADGSMSVQPLAMGRKLAHPRASVGGDGKASATPPSPPHRRAAPPAQLVVKKSDKEGASIKTGGASSTGTSGTERMTSWTSATSNSTSNNNITHRSNSVVKNGLSSRLAASFVAVGGGGGTGAGTGAERRRGYLRQSNSSGGHDSFSFPGSPSSVTSSTTGSLEKVKDKKQKHGGLISICSHPPVNSMKCTSTVAVSRHI